MCSKRKQPFENSRALIGFGLMICSANEGLEKLSAIFGDTRRIFGELNGVYGEINLIKLANKSSDCAPDGSESFPSGEHARVWRTPNFRAAGTKNSAERPTPRVVGESSLSIMFAGYREDSRIEALDPFRTAADDRKSWEPNCKNKNCKSNCRSQNEGSIRANKISKFSHPNQDHFNLLNTH